MLLTHSVLTPRQRHVVALWRCLLIPAKFLQEQSTTAGHECRIPFEFLQHIDSCMNCPAWKFSNSYVYPTERASVSCLTTYRNCFPKRHQLVFIKKTEHVLCEVWSEFLYRLFIRTSDNAMTFTAETRLFFPRPVLVGFVVDNEAVVQDFCPSTSVFLCQCHSTVAPYSYIYHGYHPILLFRCVVDSTHRSWGLFLAFLFLNPLTPDDPYRGRTAPLTSKRCILYIYSTNIGTEYFKRGIYSPFLAVCLHFMYLFNKYRHWIF